MDSSIYEKRQPEELLGFSAPEGEGAPQSWIAIAKSYTFEAAHQLEGHEGKCRNVHGHSYGVTIHLAGYVTQRPGHSSDGMLIDYHDLDDMAKPIIEALDHSFIAKGDEKVVAFLETIKSKVCIVGARTTAENLAWYITKMISSPLRRKYPNVRNVSVTVRETAKTEATYE